MKKRISTGDESFRWTSPFQVLKQTGSLSDQPSSSSTNEPNEIPRPSRKNRGRVDILRQTAHRGGKTVTVIKGFVGISQDEKESLAKEMQKACGAGGTVKEGRIEIQGDQRTTVMRILTTAGFRPILAGG